MRKALYAGSFDPFHFGHEWMIEQGIKLFDHLYVLIAKNPKKKSFLTDQEKLEVLKNKYTLQNKVTLLHSHNDLTADIAYSCGAQYLLRGIRNSIDFEYESQVETMNQWINSNIQTIYLRPRPEYTIISSSMIKSLIGFEDWERRVRSMVPGVSWEAIDKKVKENHGN